MKCGILTRSERNSQQEDGGRNKLNTNWNQPSGLGLVVCHGFAHSRAPHGSQGDNAHETARDEASKRGWCDLGLVRWDRVFDESNTIVRNYATDGELDPFVRRHLNFKPQVSFSLSTQQAHVGDGEGEGGLTNNGNTLHCTAHINDPPVADSLHHGLEGESAENFARPDNYSALTSANVGEWEKYRAVTT